MKRKCSGLRCVRPFHATVEQIEYISKDYGVKLGWLSTSHVTDYTVTIR